MKKLVLALAVLLAVSTAGCGTASSGTTSGSASWRDPHSLFGSV